LNSMICLRKQEQSRYYIIESPEMAIALNLTTIYVRLNPNDDSKVLLYNLQNQFVGEAQLQQKVHIAQANQTTTDKLQIGKIFNQKKQFRAYIREQLKELEDPSDIKIKLLDPISYTKDEVQAAEDQFYQNIVTADGFAKTKLLVKEFPQSKPKTIMSQVHEKLQKLTQQKPKI